MRKDKRSMKSLGDRIKRYEAAYIQVLTPRSCLFVRVDGKAFHTFTKDCEKPFDRKLIDAMVQAARDTAAQMQGFKLAYVQSDECTFMLTDFDSFETQGWFNYELNKVVSISASMFSVYFNRAYGSDNALFDSRAFIAPKDDAANIFISRQQDWERNSLQMLARSRFSQKELDRKNSLDMYQMLGRKNVNCSDLEPKLKYGTFILEDGTEYCDKTDYKTLNNIFKFI